jgi:arylsulfatase A-like enzyme
LRNVLIADDTLLVVTADHGEEFGEHGSVSRKVDTQPEHC